MNNNLKMTLFWVLAFFVTASAAVYQKLTGPTYPKKATIELHGSEYKLKLLRSHQNDKECFIKLNIPDEDVRASLFYHRFKVEEDYLEVPFNRNTDNELVAELPNQSAAGKLQYYIHIESENQFIELFNNDPIVIRFKDPVPNWILIPHIFFMFFAMLISTLAGILAIAKHKRFRMYSFIAIGLLLAGGMILGPVVQLYAFGDLWTGIPFGWDLTDNKTLIAVLFWVIAIIFNWKKENRKWVIIAAIVLLLVYSIPHSMFGSELDYTTGTITQG